MSDLAIPTQLRISAISGEPVADFLAGQVIGLASPVTRSAGAMIPASSLSLSEVAGISTNPALVGEVAPFIRTADLDFGANVLEQGYTYVLSDTPGRMKLIRYLTAGEYLHYLGFAVTASILRLMIQWTGVVVGDTFALRRYVAPITGNDANSGTETSPWKTRSRIATAIAANDPPAGTWVKGGKVPVLTTEFEAAFLNYTTVNTGGSYLIVPEGPLQLDGVLTLGGRTMRSSVPGTQAQLYVNKPLPKTGWTNPSGVVWKLAAGATTYYRTMVWEKVGGQWAQYTPVVAANVAAATTQVQATAGSSYPDPLTGDLYVHMLGGGSPNTAGIDMEYTPDILGGVDGQLLDFSGGYLLDLSADMGATYDPTNGTTGQGGNVYGQQIGAGTGWVTPAAARNIGVIRFNKHGIALVGTAQASAAVLDGCSVGGAPGGIGTGAWTAYVNFSGGAGPGTIQVTCNNCTTPTGQQNLGAVGTSNVFGTSFYSHNTGGTNQFLRQTFTNCNFRGQSSLGNAETVQVVSSGSVYGDLVSLATTGTGTQATTSTNDTFNSMLPNLAGTVVFTSPTFVTGPNASSTFPYTGALPTIVGNVTMTNPTIDTTLGTTYTSTWNRTAGLTFNVTGGTIKQNPSYFGVPLRLFQLVHSTDTFLIQNSTVSGSSATLVFGYWNGVSGDKSWGDLITMSPPFASGITFVP